MMRDREDHHHHHHRRRHHHHRNHHHHRHHNEDQMNSNNNLTGKHDISLSSSLSTSCSPGPLKSVEGWVVFVTGVHEEAQEDDLADAFSEYGRVKSVHLNLDRKTGFVKGYALIEFEIQEHAQDAINSLHGSELLGKVVGVHWAFCRTPTSSSSSTTTTTTTSTTMNNNGNNNRISSQTVMMNGNDDNMKDDDDGIGIRRGGGGRGGRRRHHS